MARNRGAKGCENEKRGVSCGNGGKGKRRVVSRRGMNREPKERGKIVA